MGYLAIVVTSLLAAVTVPLLKLLVETVSISTLLFFRFSAAFLIFLVFFIPKRTDFYEKRYIEKLLLGLYSFANAVAILIIVYGLKVTSVAHANTIMMFIPVLVAIGATTLLKERINRKQLFGMSLGLFGVFLILLNSNSIETARNSSLYGNLLILASAIISAANILLARKLSTSFKPFTIAFGCITANMLTNGIFVLHGALNGAPLFSSSISSSTLIQFTFLVVFSTCIMFVVYQYGISKTSAFFAGMSNYLKFPFSVYIGVLVFGDLINQNFLLASILVIIGSFLASNLFTKKTPERLLSE